MCARGSEELYATPALAGAMIAAVLHHYEVQQGWYAIAVGICIVWRIVALKRGWKAPLPPGIDRG